ncbi:uncharacterized protein LOC135835069 isoform X2 [Planococcus citri]|uniref:uncharacterized protein LOC135835069 isoform X2 n=1 Tax=Planococcus citri TaxID=170843 RepID=UPI0031F9B3EF
MTRLRSILTSQNLVWIFIILALFIDPRPLEGATFDEEFTSAKYFIDKTTLLQKFFENEARVFVTAPQGFGKTTTLKMIQKFSEIKVNDNGNISLDEQSATKNLFQNLKIGQNDENTVAQHLAQHPVIFFDMRLQIEGEITKDKILEAYRVQLNETFYPYRWLVNHFLMDDRIRLLRAEQTALKKTMGGSLLEFEIKESIRYLANLLNAYFNKSVVLLIDNYDYIVHNSFIESKGCVDTAYSIFEEMLFKSYQVPKVIGYTMMTSITTIGFQCFGLHRYLNQYSFYNSHTFSSYFGINGTEIQNLDGIYIDFESKLPIIEKYCGGYAIRGENMTIYNTSCVVEYLEATDNATWISQQNPSEPTKYLWKLFKISEYLDQASKMLKYTTIRHGRNDLLSLTNFTKIALEDFDEPSFSSGANSSMFSYMIQTGFLSPIKEGRSLFVIPNLQAQNQLKSDLFHYYEKIANIDLKSIGSRIGEFFNPERNYTGPRINLMQVLTAEFAKVKPLYGPFIKNTTNRTTISIDYVYQSIIHLAGLTNQQIQVIEDFPQPICFEKNSGNLIRRSVTRVQKDGVPLIIKISDQHDLESLMNLARKKYDIEKEPDVKLAVFLAIRLEPDRKVLIDVRTSTFEDEISGNTTYHYVTSFPKKTKIPKIKINKTKSERTFRPFGGSYDGAYDK